MAKSGKVAGKKAADGTQTVASNRKARHDYLIEDTWEAGLALMGTEVKALRMGRASLVDGYAAFQGHELWLEGVHIPEYVQGTWTNHTPRRRRKLLLHRHELDKIHSKINESGKTVVPLRLYFKDGRAKVEIALATGKKHHDKRQALREKQDRREAEREMGVKRR
ncbi:SsrA-binding protein SmpB [Janibacter massiliensis]|uniref:SsrA-binding protein SmpB n=1 Tax=Janibacter massiliensis TaxID=2058291 RepID=UPI000D0EDA19|nr:SsrA-binding protein SmpB [Janibacter massiliensis]